MAAFFAIIFIAPCEAIVFIVDRARARRPRGARGGGLKRGFGKRAERFFERSREMKKKQLKQDCLNTHLSKPGPGPPEPRALSVPPALK